MGDLEKQELADDAEWLLQSKSFIAATLELRKLWFGQLMTMELTGSQGDLTGTARCATLVAKLQALEAIPAELKRIITNSKYDTGPKRNG